MAEVLQSGGVFQKHDCIITALITPFLTDGDSIDYDSLKNLIKCQKDAGMTWVLVGGSTAEPHTMDHGEWQKYVAFGIEETHKVGLKCIVGTGTNSTTLSVENTRFAWEKGADAVMLTCPYYNKPSPRMLIAHFTAICQAVPAVPVVLYNVPSRTGVHIDASTAIECSIINPNVMGYKEATADMDNYKRLREGLPERVALFCGEDGLMIEAMQKMKFDGNICVTSNAFPGQFKKMHTFCLEGNYDEAQNMMTSVSPIIAAMFIEPNPVPIKYLCGKIYGHEDTMRMPLMSVTQETKDFVDGLLSGYDATI